MDMLIIILGILVIILIYYIYTVLNAVPSVGNNIDLTKPPTLIKSSTINDPYSANYTIAAWVYIFNFASDNEIERFLIYGDTTNNGKNSYWSLRMDKSTPTLYCDILVNDTSEEKKKIQTVQITNNFPIQKWVYVVTTVSSGFIECYLNGAFVLAQTLQNSIFQGTPPTDANAGATFTFGAQGTAMDNGVLRNNGSPIVLNLVSRWNYPLSAGDVYNNYNKGNGQTTNIWGPAYHMNINLSQGKDNYVLPIF